MTLKIMTMTPAPLAIRGLKVTPMSVTSAVLDAPKINNPIPSANARAAIKNESLIDIPFACLCRALFARQHIDHDKRSAPQPNQPHGHG